MKHTYILALATALLIVPTAAASPEPPEKVTVDDVLTWMSRVPMSEYESSKKGLLARRAPWHKIADAREIAQAIVNHARDRAEARRMTVYAVWESGNDKHAHGDFHNGKPESFGTWQLSWLRASPEIAENPDRAAPIWLSAQDDTRAMCTKRGNPPEEALAALASGRCDRGKKKVRHREEVAAGLDVPVDSSAR